MVDTPWWNRDTAAPDSRRSYIATRKLRGSGRPIRDKDAPEVEMKWRTDGWEGQSRLQEARFCGRNLMVHKTLLQRTFCLSIENTLYEEVERVDGGLREL